jgi:hypothetical protein
VTQRADRELRKDTRGTSKNFWKVEKKIDSQRIELENSKRGLFKRL